MVDDAEIRHHFPNEIALGSGELVFCEKILSGPTVEWLRCDAVPEDVRDIESVRAFVRNIALARGGVAWRAVTERGEILCVFSVYDLADELSSKPVITLHPRDQLCLAAAQALLNCSDGGCSAD